MEVLGKRKMCSIMSNETALPYKDVALYGIYRKYGNVEELKIGHYELIHVTVGDNHNLTIWEPDFTDSKPKYCAREVSTDVY